MMRVCWSECERGYEDHCLINSVVRCCEKFRLCHPHSPRALTDGCFRQRRVPLHAALSSNPSHFHCWMHCHTGLPPAELATPTHTHIRFIHRLMLKDWQMEDSVSQYSTVHETKNNFFPRKQKMIGNRVSGYLNLLFYSTQIKICSACNMQ